MVAVTHQVAVNVLKCLIIQDPDYFCPYIESWLPKLKFSLLIQEGLNCADSADKCCLLDQIMAVGNHFFSPTLNFIVKLSVAILCCQLTAFNSSEV